MYAGAAYGAKSPPTRHDPATLIKFMFSKKATKIDEIFTVNLTLCSKCQINGEDLVNFCGLFRKYELYLLHTVILPIGSLYTYSVFTYLLCTLFCSSICNKWFYSRHGWFG